MTTTYDLWQTKWYASDQLIYEINGKKNRVYCVSFNPTVDVYCNNARFTILEFVLIVYEFLLVLRTAESRCDSRFM